MWGTSGINHWPTIISSLHNDLAIFSDMLSFRLFADDANIFCAAKTPKDLEAVMKPELQKVINYCNLNKLSILTLNATLV